MKCPALAWLCMACCWVSFAAAAENFEPPNAVTNPGSQLMLDLPESGTDPAKIEFSKLPVLNGEHAVVSVADEAWQFRLHNYLAHDQGKYWCFWSHGPVIEDKATQHLRYATSADGLHWTPPQVMAPPPRKGYGYIARGFWIRNGELLALASLFEAPNYQDGDLELVAFRLDPTKQAWQSAGRVFDNALNNFAPQKLPAGEWMMSRRASDRSVSILIGGVKAIDDWQVIPFSTYRTAEGGMPEEPCWWLLPSGNIVGAFRDNSRSGRLMRSFSTDSGRSWTPLVRTNFPDATSKFYVFRTSSGYWVMVSNPNPRGRNPLCLSVSRDGMVFTRMARLPIPEHLEQLPATPGSPANASLQDSLQYPHVIEHERHLLVAFSRRKQTVEVVKVPLAEVDAMVANTRSSR
jgi:hypothetical protein